MKGISLETKGMKCDNPNCDFRDKSVKIEDLEEWLNKPCPKCGTNLLTESDYRSIRYLLDITGVINEITKDEEVNSDVITLELGMNGTGKFDIKNINKNNEV